MDPLATRELGRSGVRVTQMGFGGASIGSLFNVVPEQDAVATVRAAWDAGLRLFDTSPYYGHGLSELRIGSGLRGQPRDAYVLSSKVGRWLKRSVEGSAYRPPAWAGANPFEVVFDYSYDGIMRSYEQSLQRLGVACLDLVVIHDLDFGFHRTEAGVAAYEAQLLGSGWRALEELKRARTIRAIGAGINQRVMLNRWMERVDLDFFLVALPYTLLDHEVLDDEFPRIQQRGIGVIIGAVFASGILATGPTSDAKYAYGPAPEAIIQRVERISEVCARHGVPLAAAALQFPLGHPSVASVIPGGFIPDHVTRNVELFRMDIPPRVWEELKHEGLIRPDAPVPALAGAGTA